MKTKLSLTLALSALLLILAQTATAAPCTGPRSILRVRNTVMGNYEYVVFDYVRPPAANYSVTAVTGPTFEHDASGDPITVAGNRWRQIRFKGINWTCSIAHNVTTPRPAIKDVKSTGQFEGVVTYVVGYRASAIYVNTYTYTVGNVQKVVMRFRQ